MRSKKIIIILLCLILTGCKTKTYTVTFDTLGGEVMESITIQEGESIKDIEEPKKEGYLFVSWLKDGLEYNTESPVTEDINLTANWVEQPTILETYNITFVIDGKTDKTTVKENEMITKPKDPIKENYLFLGWYVGDELYDFNSKVTKDIILTAKFELNQVTITYDLDGGFGLAIETIPKYTTLSIPEPPTKIGYKFVKWTLNGKDFSFSTKISEDITLKAIWEKIEYVTITYDTDGGEIIKPTTIERYSKLNNTTFDSDAPIDSDIILKAIYEVETKTE